MIYSNLLKSTALIAGLTASANALTHYKSGDANLVKRATELGNTGITYDISEEGLSTSATFAVDYDDVIIVKGYVVSANFNITASDSGFAITASYDNATQFCEDADKWMLVYSYDGSTPALIAPDCDNYFTLLNADGSVIDWKAGGCLSIGSLAAANPVCAGVSATSTAATVSPTTAAPTTTFTEIVITETVSGTVTDYTTYCPLTSGEPDYTALSTSIVTVSEGVTTTVVVPCSECAEKASSAVSAASAAAATATTTGSSGSGLYVETTYVSGTVTVTSYVPCPSETGATGATTEATGVTGAATGATAAEVTGTATGAAAGEVSTVYTTYTTTAANGESSVVTSAVGTSTAPAAAATEASTGYTTYTTTVANGAASTVTSAVAAAGAEGSSSSAAASGSAASGTAAPSVLEGGASIKLASSGLIGAAIAMFLL